MHKTLLLTLFTLTASIALPVQAQVYQWKDSSGRTVISDLPPPSTVRDKRAIGEKRPAVATENSGEEKPAGEAKVEPKAPLSAAEKELEFRKRQQESREKAEKRAKEEAAAKEKQETCNRARTNLGALESKTPIVKMGSDGEQQAMDAAQRDAEIERTRRIMQEACK